MDICVIVDGWVYVCVSVVGMCVSRNNQSIIDYPSNVVNHRWCLPDTYTDPPPPPPPPPPPVLSALVYGPNPDPDPPLLPPEVSRRTAFGLPFCPCPWPWPSPCPCADRAFLAWLAWASTSSASSTEDLPMRGEAEEEGDSDRPPPLLLPLLAGVFVVVLMLLPLLLSQYPALAAFVVA